MVMPDNLLDACVNSLRERAAISVDGFGAE